MSMMDPKDLKKWLLLIAILYLIVPRDLIPDFAGRGIGLIDDLALMGLFTYFFRNYARRYLAQQGSRSNQQHERPQGPTHDSFAAGADPYAVLGIGRGASQKEIQTAYRARMREYHPDKVAHLGEDLQKLAHHRSLEIQKAYQRLRR
jgi:DnaJ like chaperone protein